METVHFDDRANRTDDQRFTGDADLRGQRRCSRRSRFGCDASRETAKQCRDAKCPLEPRIHCRQDGGNEQTCQTGNDCIEMQGPDSDELAWGAR